MANSERGDNEISFGFAHPLETKITPEGTELTMALHATDDKAMEKLEKGIEKILGPSIETYISKKSSFLDSSKWTSPWEPSGSAWGVNRKPEEN